MNERIKKLAKQTGYIWHAGGDPQIYEFTPEKLEKFVELIVGECMSIAQEYDGAKLGGPGLIIAMRIEQHFGVEE